MNISSNPLFKENNEENIFCPKCMLICTNKNFIFPLDQNNLMEYYCNKKDIYHFIKDFSFKKEFDIKDIKDNLLSFDLVLNFYNYSIYSNMNIEKINFF